MPANTIGQMFSVASYGESHGDEVGVLIDGCPAGIEIDHAFIQAELDRRKPGQSSITTQRKEADAFEIVSGVFKNKSTGSPLVIKIPNQNQRSSDYKALEDIYRPSHADQTYDLKYGFRDHRGGGRSSARITAGWVAAGAIAKLLIKQYSSTEIRAFVKQIHTISFDVNIEDVNWGRVEKNIVRCPDQEIADKMIASIEVAREQGDSLGGVIRGAILQPLHGLGEPVFDKFNARLGAALLSINAVKGVSFGEGFDLSAMKGSEANDSYENSIDGRPSRNQSGGIIGGITNGNTIYFDVAFKPTASISKDQSFLDKSGQVRRESIIGRHDPCVVPRAVPIVEAMAAITYLDLLLIHRGRA